jgi:hypothetical protein
LPKLGSVGESLAEMPDGTRFGSLHPDEEAGLVTAKD